MNRRISPKRKAALDQLRLAYLNSTTGRIGGTVRAGCVRRYARLWLLATGELPTGIHEVPYGFNLPYKDSTEVDFDALHHVPSSLPVPEPAR